MSLVIFSFYADGPYCIYQSPMSLTLRLQICIYSIVFPETKDTRQDGTPADPMQMHMRY